MRRGWILGMFVTTMALGWTSGVQARHDGRDERGGEETNQGAVDARVGKALAMVDLYLVSAGNNLKVLSSLADLPAGSTDKQIVAETRANLATALDRATLHLKLARKAGSDDKAMTGGIKELERHLTEARAAARKLGKGRLADMGSAVDLVATHVMAADQVFGKVAQSAGIMRLETMRLGAAPVRGRDVDADAGRGADPDADGPEGADDESDSDFLKEPTPERDPKEKRLPPPARDGAPPSSTGKNYP